MRLMALPLLLALAFPAQAKTLLPKDECAAAKDFQPVRQRFLATIKARDSKALLTLAAPDILWSMGGGYGKADFSEHWRLNKGKASAIWPVLDQLLPLGCAVESDSIIYPYLSARLQEEEDENTKFVTTGTNINLRSAPALSSNIISKLSWEIVTEIEAPKVTTYRIEDWARIRTDKGLTGYVSRDFLRGAYSWRVTFGKQKGVWVLTSLVEGD